MKQQTDDFIRYSRQTILPGVGAAGQQQLQQARVLVIGMGGLGSPIAMYLAAAGVGTLGLADHDRVELSNLHRQILHDDDTVGRPKVDSAAARLRALHPQLRLQCFADGITPENALDIISGFDLVVDGSDNFPTRYLVNDAAVLAGKPLVYGSIFQFEGQVTVFAPGSGGPCYRCLFPRMPEPGAVPNCAEAGVFGALCGIVGSWQAAEALKWLLGLGTPLLGRMKVMDIRSARERIVALKPDPDCPLCGSRPTITTIDADNYVMTCSLQEDAMNEAAGNAGAVALEISAEEAHAALQRKDAPLLLDVREEEERAFCRIGDGPLIPVWSISEQWQQLPRDRDIIVYCHHGMRSLNAVQLLRSKGLQRTRSLRGGIDRWSRDIDANVPRY